MDYLTRLIQRTARTAPAVLPLSRSRYALEDGETPPLDESTDEFVTEALPAASPEIARTPPRTVPGDERSPVPSTGAWECEGAVGFVTDGVAERSPTSAVTPGPVMVESPEAGPRPMPEQRSPRAGRLNESPVLTSFVPEEADEPEHPPVIRPNEPRDDPADGLLMPRGKEEPAFPMSGDEHEPGKPLNRSEDAEPPVVRVTIGRIDVRTAPPVKRPEPAPRPGPAAPRLGLDDYLRNGGRG